MLAVSWGVSSSTACVTRCGQGSPPHRWSDSGPHGLWDETTKRTKMAHVPENGSVFFFLSQSAVPHNIKLRSCSWRPTAARQNCQSTAATQGKIEVHTCWALCYCRCLLTDRGARALEHARHGAGIATHIALCVGVGNTSASSWRKLRHRRFKEERRTGRSKPHRTPCTTNNQSE